MKVNRKLFVVVVLAALLSLSLRSGAVAAKKTKLVIWSWTRDYLLEPAAKSYQKVNPDVEIEVVIFGFGDLWKKLVASIPAGVGPDMFWMHTYRIEAFASAGQLAEMPLDLFPPDFVEGFLSPDAYGFIDGKRYVLPWSSQGSVIIYNTKMWAEAGLEPFKNRIPTWVEFRDMTKKLVKKDARGEITQSGFAMRGLGDRLWRNLFFQQGRYLLSDDGKKFYGNSKESLKAGEFIMSFYDMGIDSRDFPECIKALGSGVSATSEAGGWGLAVLEKQYPEMKDIFGALPYPTWTGKPTPCQTSGNQLLSLAVPETTKNKRESFKFIKWTLSDKENMKFWILKERQCPAQKDFFEDPEIMSDELVSMMTKMAPYSINVRTPAYMASIMSKYITGGMIDTKMSVEEAMNEAQAEIEAEMRRNPLSPWEYDLSHYTYDYMLRR